MDSSAAMPSSLLNTPQTDLVAPHWSASWLAREVWWLGAGTFEACPATPTERSPAWAVSMYVAIQRRRLGSQKREALWRVARSWECFPTVEDLARTTSSKDWRMESTSPTHRCVSSLWTLLHAPQHTGPCRSACLLTAGSGITSATNKSARSFNELCCRAATK